MVRSTILLIAISCSISISQVEHGTIAIIYANEDSAVIGADSKILVRLGNITTTMNDCKIFQIDRNVYFTMAGIERVTHANRMTPKNVAIEACKKAISLPDKAAILKSDLRKVFLEYIGLCKEMKPNPLMKDSTVETALVGIHDKKPAFFINAFTAFPSFTKYDSLRIDTIRSPIWSKTKKFDWRILGGAGHKLYAARDTFPELPNEEGAIVGIQKLIILEATVFDTTDIGLPLDVVCIKPDPKRTYWLPNGACKP